MFNKKPKTVAQAVAPFKKVQEALADVIATATETRQAAERQASEALAVSYAAKAEMDQAVKIQRALAQIVGDE